MDTITSIGLAVGVACAVGIVWWLFSIAPPRSRLAALDRRVGEWGRRRVGRPLRATHVGWLVVTVFLLVILVWAAAAGRY